MRRTDVTLRNQGVNIGHSSRLDYDPSYIRDSIKESTDPLSYQLSTDRIYNCNTCATNYGPRPSSNTNGISSAVLLNANKIAVSQSLVDLETVFSNRNVKATKDKRGMVQDINVLQIPLQGTNVCSNFLDPISTHLTNPPQNYRGIVINRFYDLNRNPQENIYYDWGSNTRLEAKDNYIQKVPVPMKNNIMPVEKVGPIKQCGFVCRQ